METALAAFLRALEGQNRSPLTLQAYGTDLRQFLRWLHENTVVATTPAHVTRADISEYLAHLGRHGISGVSRARKLAAIREYFRFLLTHELLARSPAEGVATPKKEKNARTWLRLDEYRALLAQAGAHPRDYAILVTFLQTGVRVSELGDLRLDDVDLVSRTLRVRGKGQKERVIELERKGTQALKNWLTNRPRVFTDHLFLNAAGKPLSVRGVKWLLTQYRRRAGITRRAGAHVLRHTFATVKAEKGVSPFQLQEWLGHESLNTTQIYVHLARQNARKVMEATSL